LEGLHIAQHEQAAKKILSAVETAAANIGQKKSTWAPVWLVGGKAKKGAQIDTDPIHLHPSSL
jgi:hypothetical protein